MQSAAQPLRNGGQVQGKSASLQSPNQMGGQQQRNSSATGQATNNGGLKTNPTTQPLRQLNNSALSPHHRMSNNSPINVNSSKSKHFAWLKFN